MGLIVQFYRSLPHFIGQLLKPDHVVEIHLFTKPEINTLKNIYTSTKKIKEIKSLKRLNTFKKSP